MSIYFTLVHLQHAALSTPSDSEELEDSHSDTEVIPSRQTLNASDESNESDADL